MKSAKLKTKPSKPVARPVQNRALDEPQRPDPTKRRPGVFSRAILPTFLILHFAFCLGAQATLTVTGLVNQITSDALDTKIMFQPAADIMVSTNGLIGGPAKTVTSTNGAFRSLLSPGIYLVRLPLIPGRAAFTINVGHGTGSTDITNLIAEPWTYEEFVESLSTNAGISSATATNIAAYQAFLATNGWSGGSGTSGQFTPSANRLTAASNELAATTGVFNAVQANTFSGSGAALTSLNGSQITSGTVPEAQLPHAVTNVINYVDNQSLYINKGTGDNILSYDSSSYLGTDEGLTTSYGITARGFEGSAIGLTNGTPALATNWATATDGTVLSKQGNNLALIPTTGGGDLIGANSLADIAGLGGSLALARTNLSAHNADNLTRGTVALPRLPSLPATLITNWPTKQNGEVSVTDYGVTPYIPVNITTGSYLTNATSLTDYSAQIQSAFTAAYASGGASNTVFFPKGIYRITTNLYVPAGINVRGVGVLHSGDFGEGVSRLNTNAYSVIWQSSTNRAGLLFNHLNEKGSEARMIEVCGYTNPIAILDTTIAVAPSSTLADGPGMYVGNFASDPITGDGNAGAGYSGDMKIDSVAITGFKVGVRSTANSGIYSRLWMNACDVGFSTSTNCCGGDQLIFANCSANLRPNGIGYVFKSGGGNRGTVFLSPSDYQIGTWLVATDAVITVQGGNLEFTHASTTAANFAELYGSRPSLTMTGTRFQGLASYTNLIYYGDNSYGGPFGSLNGCRIEMTTTYNSTTWTAQATNQALPQLLSVNAYHAGGFSVSGGTEGWGVVRGYHAWPMSEGNAFAPPIFQPYAWGAYAWIPSGRAGAIAGQYGKAWVIRGGITPDYMEVWLADDYRGPMVHRKVILGDSTASTSNAAPNTVTLDSVTATTASITTQSNTILNVGNLYTVLTNAATIGTDANGKIQVGSGSSGTGSSNLTDVGTSVYVKSSMLFTGATGGLSLGRTNAVASSNIVEIYSGSTLQSRFITNGVFAGPAQLTSLKLDYPQSSSTAATLVGMASAGSGANSNVVVSTTFGWTDAGGLFGNGASLTNLLNLVSTNVVGQTGVLAPTSAATNYTVALLPGAGNDPLLIYSANTNLFITFTGTNSAFVNRSIIIDSLSNTVSGYIHFASPVKTNFNFVFAYTNGQTKVVNFFNPDTRGTNVLVSDGGYYRGNFQ